MFKIQMLPAGYGDCLWIEYGERKKKHQVLIDAGTLPTYKVLRSFIQNDPSRRNIELFIITHIDTDHIDAAVKLLNSRSLGLRFKEIWFNEWKHLVDMDKLGERQGEYVAALIAKNRLNLNTAFGGEAVVVPEEGSLPVIPLPGGMKLTLLSPGPDQLRRLRRAWKKVMGDQAGNAVAALKELSALKKYADVLGRKRTTKQLSELAQTISSPDRSVPNGSSIAVLAEYNGTRCLFAGDCHPDVLETSVARVLRQNKKSLLALDALKVPHHGSKHNVTRGLLQKLRCQNYLFSTNGKLFHHPDPEGVARVISYGGPHPRLYFNYDSKETRIWDDSQLKRRYKYEVFIPQKTQMGIEVVLKK